MEALLFVALAALVVYGVWEKYTPRSFRR